LKGILCELSNTLIAAAMLQNSTLNKFTIDIDVDIAEIQKGLLYARRSWTISSCWTTAM